MADFLLASFCLVGGAVAAATVSFRCHGSAFSTAPAFLGAAASPDAAPPCPAMSVTRSLLQWLVDNGVTGVGGEAPASVALPPPPKAENQAGPAQG